MSAIEVLKGMKESIEDSWQSRNKEYKTAIINISLSQVKYIDEALLALEKVERQDKLIESLENRVWDLENKSHDLKAWLEREIKLYEKSAVDYLDKNTITSFRYENVAQKLKEVLGLVK